MTNAGCASPTRSSSQLGDPIRGAGDKNDYLRTKPKPARLPAVLPLVLHHPPGGRCFLSLHVTDARRYRRPRAAREFVM